MATATSLPTLLTWNVTATLNEPLVLRVVAPIERLLTVRAEERGVNANYPLDTRSRFCVWSYGRFMTC